MLKYGALSQENMDNVIIEQGYSMDKPSEILVSLSTLGDKIEEVRVGGKALNISEIEVEI